MAIGRSVQKKVSFQFIILCYIGYNTIDISGFTHWKNEYLDTINRSKSLELQ